MKMFFSRLGVQEVNILRDIDFPLGGQILLSCIQIGDYLQELINKEILCSCMFYVRKSVFGGIGDHYDSLPEDGFGLDMFA